MFASKQQRTAEALMARLMQEATSNGASDPHAQCAYAIGAVSVVIAEILHAYPDAVAIVNRFGKVQS